MAMEQRCHQRPRTGTEIGLYSQSCGISAVSRPVGILQGNRWGSPRNDVVHRRLTDLQHLVTLQTRRPAPLGVEPALLFIPVSDRGALRRLRRLRGVELPVPLFDAASSLMPGNDDAHMVRASPLACSGDFLLRLAVGQGEHLIAEGRRGALAASRCCGRSAQAPAWSRWRGRLRCCGRCPG